MIQSVERISDSCWIDGLFKVVVSEIDEIDEIDEMNEIKSIALL